MLKEFFNIFSSDSALQRIMHFIQHICALIFVFSLSSRTNVLAGSPMTNEMDLDKEGNLAGENNEMKTRLESFIDATITKALQDTEMTAADMEESNADDMDDIPR